jgi:hypothetical protein
LSLAPGSRLGYNRRRGDALRKRSLAVRGVVALFLASLALSSCGYRLRGTGSFLPAHIKSLAVPLFKNASTRYELDLKLTQAVQNEFVARGKVEIVPDAARADAVLEGGILGFAVGPIAFAGGQSSADRYAITIVASIVLKDQKSGQVIFENPSYVYQTEYEVPQGTDFESSETTALNKIAELFARTLVITILEGF